MALRKTLEPDWETAEKLYPAVLALIYEYTNYCDENGDENFVEYKKLKIRLYEITCKDMSQYNLRELWEEESVEVLSFKIALPLPILEPAMSHDDLTEIVKRIKTVTWQDGEDSFKQIFENYITDYYHALLKLNFKNYKPQFFNRQKGKDGKYFEYSIDEISSKILG